MIVLNKAVYSCAVVTELESVFRIYLLFCH